MSKMRAVQVGKPKAPFEVVERDIPEPGPGTVRIKVQACGVCHSDSLTKEGMWPGIEYPRVPGHEVVGLVDALGPNVAGWTVGERVGVGWNGGYCGYCEACRRGEFFACQTATRVTGITSDGGYADYMIAQSSAVARVPKELSEIEAAPLLCAGVTTFNALRHSGAGPGDVVAILGLGGLGHLGVQYAAKMGFKNGGDRPWEGQRTACARWARRTISITRPKIRRPSWLAWEAQRRFSPPRRAVTRWRPSWVAWLPTAQCWSSERSGRSRSIRCS